MRLEIYIDNQLLDIDDNTKLSFNLKGTDITQLTTRSVSYTGTLRIPFSPNNDTIYDHVKLLNKSSSFPYTQQTVRVLLNGVQLITDGVHVLQKISGEYQLRVLSNQAEFFNTIKDKNLNDLDFTDLNGVWDMDATANASGGVVGPVLDYGKFSFHDIHDQTYLPSIYWATIISKIFSDNGFNHYGPAFANWRHLQSIMPYSKDLFEYTQQFSDDRSGEMAGLATQGPWALAVSASFADKVDFDNLVSQDSLGFIDVPNDWYQPADADATDGAVIFSGSVRVSINIVVSSGTVNLIMYEETTLTIDSLVTGLVTGTYVVTVPGILFRNNRYKQLVVQQNAGASTVTINGVRLSVDVERTPQLTWLYFQELMPDITQLSLIKEFVQLNGVVFDNSGDTVDCYRLEDIIRQRVPAAEPLSNWVVGTLRAFVGPPFDWTLGATPSTFTSLTFPGSEYIWCPYPTKKNRTYRVSYNINFGANGTSVLFVFLDERGIESTVLPSGIYNTGTVAGTQDILAVNNGVWLGLYVETGGLAETTTILSVGIVDIDPKPTFENWTGKRVDGTEADRIDFTGLGYAQDNFVLFGNPDDLNGVYNFKSSLTVANTNLALEKNLISSIFGCSGLIGHDEIRMAEIPAYEPATVTRVIDNAIGLRLLLVRQRYSYETAVTFITSQTKYKVAEWHINVNTLKDGQSLRPQYIIEENYNALKVALQRARVVTRDYDLDEVDIAHFKFYTLVFDKDVLLLKISASPYIPGKSVSVTFLKV